MTKTTTQRIKLWHIDRDGRLKSFKAGLDVIRIKACLKKFSLLLAGNPANNDTTQFIETTYKV